MNRCPSVQRCAVCRRQLIHKGSRQAHESSSLFGQIVHNLCPPVFTFTDLDALVYRRSIRLLRLIEHKSPGQHRKPAQGEALALLARILEHVKSCPAAAREFSLHERSGVFLIEGDPHEGSQLGPSLVTRFHDGKTWEPASELDALCWVAFLQGIEREKVRERLGRRRHPSDVGKELFDAWKKS